MAKQQQTALGQWPTFSGSISSMRVAERPVRRTPAVRRVRAGPKAAEPVRVRARTSLENIVVEELRRGDVGGENSMVSGRLGATSTRSLPLSGRHRSHRKQGAYVYKCGGSKVMSKRKVQRSDSFSLDGAFVPFSLELP